MVDEDLSYPKEIDKAFWEASDKIKFMSLAGHTIRLYEENAKLKERIEKLEQRKRPKEMRC